MLSCGVGRGAVSRHEKDEKLLISSKCNFNLYSIFIHTHILLYAREDINFIAAYPTNEMLAERTINISVIDNFSFPQICTQL